MVLAALALALTSWLHAQPALLHGDVIVAGYRETVDAEGFPAFVSTIRIYGRDGVFQRELVTSSERQFSEPYVRDGIVFVGTRFPDAIERIDAAGTFLAPFTNLVNDINDLSPGPNGGLIAASASEIYQFAADGTLLRYRDITTTPLAGGGLDLAADRCTVIHSSNGALARWDACLDTPAAFFTSSLAGASGAVRILPDGTFLAALLSRVVHRASDGTVIREYPIPNSTALALDVDGTSFWTNAGNYLLHVEIATGAVLSETYTDAFIMGVGVVDEPRAAHVPAHAIPAASPGVLAVFAVILTLAAVGRLRV
ncbi:MAG TPA: hypothetical protein VEK11_25655 [Thermoanaerobaculia bacterium]|nr:hypothetical protein [Thermoanaerobaculia bacterium]